MDSVYVVLLIAAIVAIGEGCERHGAKCPNYTVVSRNEEFEIRNYPSLVWVSINGKGKSKSEVSRKLIKQLYDYLYGENSKGQKLDMMVPVRTMKAASEGYNSYTMAFALTPDQSVDPPIPTNSLITVTREPPKTYATRSFSGMARQDSIWDKHAEDLKEALSADIPFEEAFYYICVYDSPWRSENRLNEVWIEKTES